MFTRHGLIKTIPIAPRIPTAKFISPQSRPHKTISLISPLIIASSGYRIPFRSHFTLSTGSINANRFYLATGEQRFQFHSQTRPNDKMRLGKVDPSSFSEPDKITTSNVALDWTVDFENHVLRGSAKYHFKLHQKKQQIILLDVRDIKISEVLAINKDEETPVKFTISDEVKEIGSKLTLELPTEVCGELDLLIKYETSPEASALQWLTANQTLGKKNPYLFSQCQAIHARSILPCQDTPSVKFTYTAVVNHPDNLVALMSAIRLNANEGKTLFEQKVPIPSYLLAIAVGDLVSRPLGPNSSVWSEKDIVSACTQEFSETCDMLKTASDICGKYVWKQYDLLVMPPSFPFGGMENPCLTFVTPTLLAGDKSLADVVAHEIAHSWTGNLVTNKNFEHFWLNEGFTVFVEGKIIGRMKGDLERDFHAIRNLTSLQENIRTQLSNTPELQKLVVDLSECGPDEAFSSVPYIKGSTFLRYIEDLLGGPTVFEPFLKFYLNKYKFQSIETNDFKKTLNEYFKDTHAAQLKEIEWDKWLYTTGMPYKIPKLDLLIKYETSPEASALQWLTANQTLGKKNPYLFSQCQAIHARSILPCQDTPSVKFTYTAVVNHPDNLVALMSAIRLNANEGKTLFEQKVPIPSYLLAIAVGDLVSRPLGPNSSVWSEKDIVSACTQEFSETCDMLKTASDICGKYVWKQYDLLVMPPSFPFGGMENPCLTFVTPTLLAGDKSLADVVAHEIAHSWTGNLVTNKNFEHFWLNEGFTVFVEGKIIGRMKGDLERDFHAIRNLTSLQENIRTQLSNTPELQKLVVDLSECGPDEAFSSVPYIKGSTFLRYIEDLLGGPTVFEPFLKFYLNKYKFQSIETNDFKKTLNEYFKDTHAAQLKEIEWDKWLYTTGMPYKIPKYNDTLAVVCQKHADLWATKTTAELTNLPEINATLSPLQVLDFLAKLIEKDEIVDFGAEKVNLLEIAYNLNKTKNAEIQFCFLRLAIRAHLLDRMTEILAFANSNFRLKFVRPIYRDLSGWPEGKVYAIENFRRVKDQMMRVCSFMVEKDLGLV